MGFYDFNIDEENPVGNPDAPPRRKKRLIAHEPGQVPKGRKQTLKTDAYNEYFNDSWKADSLYNVNLAKEPKMFESDAQRMVAGDVDDVYDDIIIEIGGDEGDGGKQAFYDALGGLEEGDDFVMMGHSSYGKDPSYGGIPLKEMKGSIGEGVNCFLGACKGDKSGQRAADVLGRDVTAQTGHKEWTGAQEAETTTDALTRPFPGLFGEKDSRSKVYSPSVQ